MQRAWRCGRVTFLIWILIACTQLAGQERPSTFQVCLGYIAAFEELHTKFEAHERVGQKLIAEKRETYNRFVETTRTINTLLDQQKLGALALMQGEMEAISLSSELDQTLQALNPTNTRDIVIGGKAATPQASRIVANQLANLKVQMDEIQHSLKTVDKSRDLAVERYVSLIQELRKIVAEMMGWQTKSVALFQQYWELADVEGVKSDVELRAALRTLEQASKTNVGAAFARAITLLRLGEREEALAIMSRAVELPAVHTLALAARAEILARLGEEKESRMDLTKTLPTGTNNAAVRMHRAQAFAALDDFRQAEREWEAVLKLGGHEIAARRAIALINASATKANPKTKAKANENAFLAVQLAGDDWASEAAMALAAAANGEKAESLAAVERASQLAIGNNQLICDQLKQKIDAGIPVCWQF